MTPSPFCGIHWSVLSRSLSLFSHLYGKKTGVNVDFHIVGDATERKGRVAKVESVVEVCQADLVKDQNNGVDFPGSDHQQMSKNGPVSTGLRPNLAAFYQNKM